MPAFMANILEGPTPSFEAMIAFHFGTVEFHAKYESEHQNLLAQQERRLQDTWRDVVVVFPDTDWEAYSCYWLTVNTRSFFSSGLARGL
jgi:hypothetical protein